MTASTREVTHRWPAATEEGGWSLWAAFGTIQETAGRFPRLAAEKNLLAALMFPSW